MSRRLTYPVVGLLSLLALTANAQQVRVMQWNVLGGLGNAADNNSTQAKAIARIITYNQPDILLFNEVDADGLSAAQNEAAIIDWVTNNVPYLGTQPGTTFFVKASSLSDGFNRNAAISRYPILTATTYDDGLRGLHALRVQLGGTNQLQVYHAHLKCCADDCTRKQTEAQFDADTIAGVAATNSTPYVFAGDWNEDEDEVPPVCTLTSTYHPITTIRQDGGLVEFRPTTLSGEHRTWSTTSASIRFDYILAATNRLNPTSGIVFSTTDQAAHGLYTNASPLNLATDSATASDHYCVIVDYFFPTEPPNFTVAPTGTFTSTGSQGGPFSPSSQVYTLNNTNATSLSWGAVKNASWLTLSATNGTLMAGASTNIVALITNATANALAGGVYGDQITFRNTVSGAGVTRSASLTVLALPRLSVSPTATFNSSGAIGGPFSPVSQTYTLSNTGSGALNWTVGKSAAWLTLSFTSGSLAAGGSTTVVASVNANANALAAGAYGDTIGFTNTTNGLGNTNRVVSLVVVDPSVGGFSDSIEAGTNGWTAAGQWHIVSAGNPSCAVAHSATHAWWYGQNSRCDYRTGFNSNSGNLISPSFIVPAAATLTFWSWEDVQGGAGTNWDQRIVSISTNSGASWVQLYQSPTNAATWYQVTNNLAAFAGKTAQLRFRFNTGDGAFNDNTGWFVDDIVVVGPPQLTVTPATGLNAAGEQGGPFTPASQSYTLSNTGGASLSWTANVSNNWLSLSSSAGTLGTNTAVTVSTNANVTGLVGGLYSNRVSFVNATNGAGTTNLVWTLLVRDGISDAWRLQYFGHIQPEASDLSRAQDDADGDGLSNLQEQAAGTDPTDSSSSLRIISVTTEGDNVRVTWMTGDDKTNALQATGGNPGGGYATNGFVNLFVVTNTVGPATNYLDSGAATNVPVRYYRVRVLP